MGGGWGWYFDKGEEGGHGFVDMIMWVERRDGGKLCGFRRMVDGVESEDVL